MDVGTKPLVETSEKDLMADDEGDGKMGDQFTICLSFRGFIVFIHIMHDLTHIFAGI